MSDGAQVIYCNKEYELEIDDIDLRLKLFDVDPCEVLKRWKELKITTACLGANYEVLLDKKVICHLNSDRMELTELLNVIAHAFHYAYILSRHFKTMKT